jgi:Rha family phage regulatory protein
VEESDDPRDMTVFSPFLRPVGGQHKAGSNSLRVAQESGKKHKHVLEAFRKLMSELPPEIVGPNFRPVDYTDAHGQKRPMIEFCADVLTNVLAVVGGPRFHVMLYLFKQDFDRLLKAERSGELGRAGGADFIAHRR